MNQRTCSIMSKLLATLAIFYSVIGFAGTRDGGGGKSVVCRNDQGTITKAEVLDLFEGRAQFQFGEISAPKSARLIFL